MQRSMLLCKSTDKDEPSAIPGAPILKVEYLRRELDFSRLDAVHENLYLADRPLNIQLSSRQKTMQRDVLIT